MRNLFLIPFIAVLSYSCTSENTPYKSEAITVTLGFLFTEGPLWHHDGFLLFSDIPADKIYKWSPGDTVSKAYLQPSGNSNGLAMGLDGNLILAQHSGKISLLKDDGTLETLVTSYQKKRLNSPNDLVIRSDGQIYFTDPPFGVSSEERELDFSGVYRLDIEGNLTLIYQDFELPNGIAFSPDKSKLYVNDSRTGQVVRFDVLADGSVTNMIVFADIGSFGDLGGADGMVTDEEGNLFTTGPNGLIVFDADGKQIHQKRFDVQITNLAWGGENKNDLYITSSNQVFKIETNISGW